MLRIAVGVAIGVGAFLLYWRVTGRAQLSSISLPPGFSISWYTREVPNARSLTLGPDGTVFVGTRSEGSVFAVVDVDRDGAADSVYTIATDLSLPNGVAFNGGDLYVAEMHRIIKFSAIEGRLSSPPNPTVIYEGLPDRVHHGSRFMGFGPEGSLYVAVGAPCNVCQSDDERIGSIIRMDSEGNNVEVFASGIRNSVGFDFEPNTGHLWFTDNGRDFLGDDSPPDELNRAVVPGINFGFPFCHGGDVADPEFGGDASCVDFEAPVARLDAHVASLGMRFYTGNRFPAKFHGAVFIAEHGSWNRTVPVGYRITTVKMDSAGNVSYQPFAEGWLKGRRAWGRPVDVLAMPDGSLLVSDDQQGVIYRVDYSGGN